MGIYTEELKKLSDEPYAAFTRKLVPDTRYPVLGVRVPAMKSLAKSDKSNKKKIKAFLTEKHRYYEEFFLHGLFIGYLNDEYENVSRELNGFLPYIDNWAICDSTAANLKNMAKHPDKLFSEVNIMLNSDHVYTVRFALVLMLDYFVKAEYFNEVKKAVFSLPAGEYYIDMAASWLLSVWLVKEYEITLPLIEEKTLPKFIQNKTIQKAIESFRISEEKKAYLKTLKI